MNGTVTTASLALQLGGRTIEVLHHTVPAAQNTILMLHEALGSNSYWKDFPKDLAAATGWNVLLYSRAGFGWSEGPIELRDETHFLRQTNEIIPALLDHFGVEQPVLYGHSGGAGIAILFAAQHAARVKALLLESPLILPTAETGATIKQMGSQYEGSRLQKLLAQYHRNADGVFYAWTEWARGIDPKTFVLRQMLPSLTCPVLALIGAADPLGAEQQLGYLQEGVANLQYEIFPSAGHLPHREAAALVLSRATQFLGELPA